MSVIPLTLVISLCLVFTFLVFFLREHARSRLSSPERDSMLPFAEEKACTAQQQTRVISLRGHAPGSHPRHADHCTKEENPQERCHDCPSRTA